VTFYLFIFSDHGREETPGRILTLNCSKDVKSRKDVPFWGYKMKNWNLTSIYPKTLKIWHLIRNFQKVLNQSRWKF